MVLTVDNSGAIAGLGVFAVDVSWVTTCDVGEAVGPRRTWRHFLFQRHDTSITSAEKRGSEQKIYLYKNATFNNGKLWVSLTMLWEKYIYFCCHQLITTFAINRQ